MISMNRKKEGYGLLNAYQLMLSAPLPSEPDASKPGTTCRSSLDGVPPFFWTLPRHWGKVSAPSSFNLPAEENTMWSQQKLDMPTSPDHRGAIVLEILGFFIIGGYPTRSVGRRFIPVYLHAHEDTLSSKVREEYAIKVQAKQSKYVISGASYYKIKKTIRSTLLDTISK